MATVQLGSASPRPGQKAWGQLFVREGKNSVRIPVAVLHGSRPGPHLVFMANQHGLEINGFEAMRQLVEETDPRHIRGTVFCLPSMNPRAAMIMQKSWLEEHEGKLPRYDSRFTVYTDPYNMNGNWPGRKGGTLAQRVIHEVWSRAVLAPHRRADLVLDIHSHQMRTAVYARNPAGASLGIIAGCRFNIITGGEGKCKTSNSVCIQHGIMGLTIEPFGQFRFTREGVADALRAMKNLMKFWGLVPGRLDLPAVARIIDPWHSQCPWNPAKPKSCFTYYAKRDGLFLTTKQAYDLARKDEVICRILDPFTGRTIEECRTPMGGVLYMLLWKNANVKKGERLFTTAIVKNVKPEKYLRRCRLDPAFYRFEGPAVRQRACGGMP